MQEIDIRDESLAIPKLQLEGVLSVLSLNLFTRRIDDPLECMCSFKSLQLLHLNLEAYPDQKILDKICNNLSNLRELLLELPNFLNE